MKKTMAIVAAAALFLTVLFVAAGCGADKNKQDAQNYMKAGDEYMQEAEKGADYLAEKQNSFTSMIMSNDFSAFTGAAGDALKKEFEDYFSKINQNLNAAEQEYKKIIALDDVQDYKDYANKMLEGIAVDREAMQVTETLIADVSGLIAAKMAGQQVDILTSIMSNPNVQKLTDLQEKAEGLYDEAEQMKKDKKL
jgi:hypothetical protein